MLHAAADVAVDQERSVSGIGEGQRQVAREKRFPLARARAAHGDVQRRTRAGGVHEAQPQAAERFHDGSGPLTVRRVAPVDVGHRAEDR